LKNGYGNRTEINRTFVALARAAGFSAAVVRVAERDDVIFQRNVLDPTQFGGEAVVVELDGKIFYLDPGTAFCPFGMLAWEKTSTVGLRVEDNRWRFVTTPRPLSEEARIEVRADLHLEAEGTLAGTARVAFHGRSAMSRRRAALRQDEAGRKKALTDLMQSWLPANAEVTLEDVGGWDSSEEPLSASFSVKIDEWAAATGQRLLLPVAVFDSTRKHPFQHATRVHPIDFQYPIEELDELTIQLPEGFAIEGLPEPRVTSSTAGEYLLASERDGATLRIRRRLARTKFLFSPGEYSGLRRFYDDVRAGDSDQVVLRVEETNARR